MYMFYMQIYVHMDFDWLVWYNEAQCWLEKCAAEMIKDVSLLYSVSETVYPLVLLFSARFISVLLCKNMLLKIQRY